MRMHERQMAHVLAARIMTDMSSGDSDDMDFVFSTTGKRSRDEAAAAEECPSTPVFKRVVSLMTTPGAPVKCARRRQMYQPSILRRPNITGEKDL